MNFLINRKITISMLFIAISLLGYVSYKQLPVEMMPNAELPMLFVQVSSNVDVEPSYMESQVIIPLEGAVSTIDGIEQTESRAGTRNGSIRIDFKKNVNLKYTMLKLQEKINSVLPSLPTGYSVNIQKVDLVGVSNSFMTVQLRGSGGVDRLRALADKDIVPKLENIDGIAAVTVYGGRQRAIEIRINQEAAKALNITAQRISQALNQLNQERTFLGYSMEPSMRYFVHLDANFDHVSQIENIVIAPGPVYLKDIATIFFDLKDSETLSRVNGKEAISVTMINDAQVNLLELSSRTLKEIELLNEEFAVENIEMVVQSNSAEEIKTNIDEIVQMGLLGGLLAAIILWFFLRNIRLVLFITLSIPISILAAFNLFYAFDISINSLTLIGMTLAIGMLLDNSIVVLENIYRLYAHGHTAEEAVTKGTKEVTRSILAATLTTVTVFLPFVFSDDINVRLIGQHIGVSIISTLFVSLSVALLFIPMTTYVMLKRKQGDSKFFQKLSLTQRPVQIYVLLLKTSLRNPAQTVVIAMLLLFSSLIAALQVNPQAGREVNSDRLNVNVTMPSGSTLDNTDKFIESLEARLDSFPEKKDIISRIQEDAASMTIILKEGYDKKGGRSIGEISADVSRLLRTENIDIRVTAGMTQQGNGNSGANAMSSFMSMMGVSNNNERIIIKGADFETMNIVANDLRNFLEQMEFIAGVWVSSPQGRREIQLSFDPILVNTYDISRANISDGLNSLNRVNSSGAKMKLGADEYDIMIKDDISEEEEKKLGRTKSVDDLKKIQIEDNNGGLHELEMLATIRYVRGTSEIIRVNRDREITVSYTIAQSADLPKEILEAYQSEVDNLIANYNLPSGVALDLERGEDMLSEFKYLIFIALVLILMILASVFESIITPFVLLFSIPLAAIGSFVALVLSDNSWQNANTLTGFIILLGVVVNNGIILIDYVKILRKRGNNRNRAVLVAGISRLRPIMITTTTTIIALLPMAMNSDDYSGAIGAPFAITVIGGLSFSALLTLVVIPTIFVSFDNIIKWYRSLPPYLYALHGVAFAICGYYTYTSIDGIFMQMIFVMLTIVMIPGITFFAKKSIRLANKRIISSEEEIHIEVQNLVKVYDNPSLFVRQWNSGINLRKRLGLSETYTRWRDFKGMAWQIALYLFFGYLSLFYFDKMLWIFLFLVATSAGCFAVWSKIKEVMAHKHFKSRSKELTRINRAVYTVLSMVTLYAYAHRSEDISMTLLIGFFWSLGIAIYMTSNYIYRNEINVDRLEGKYADFKRTLFKMVLSIPIIGKRRKPFKALRGVSFEIKTGMFGLLGPNGAGKSTFMRIITGIFEQSYGTIWINGMDTQKYREELQSLIGFLPQEFGTYEHMSAIDFLDYQAILKGIIDPVVKKERLEYVLKSVHMWEKRNDKIGSFSGGMKQRIGIALILLHLPRILVVDEPTAGLDPRERIRFRNLLVELSQERIVIFSTHIIEDIASSCNQVVVISRGSLQYYGEPANMVQMAQNKVWTLTLSAEEFKELDPKLVANHMQDGDTIRVRYISPEQPHPNAELVAEPNLEDAYLCLLKNI